ncbi:myosin-11-like isoform X2 [Aricia agestis]|uniref:myosin-11-like isoform X2 n=1 Tax=Aricia agestis TaxID=91739 RepID=UPI001C2021B1|nr:myosin-11-like isoform X2 [Aricia agestis]
MNIDGDMNADEYFVTAVQIFDCCGVDKSSTVSVSTLMDKFAPFAKTNKSEYTFLRSLLDPDQNDPEITVSKLAATLNYYSENQKIKLDLDESFNLKGGQVPQDSDSGISSDGFQILEELQCELREKSHMAHSLRTQLDLASRDHEEALGAVIAERDTLRAQLNVMREENASLSAARADCEEACERLAAAERALAEARQELGAVRRRASRTSEQLAVMEAEKLTLQELLAQSKQECHRINEMYASRQSVLLEENEALKTDHADLSTRLQDQEEYMQQMIKEKVILEMELKDVLNKSNHIHSRIDRSIDVSYTDDQMLTALDSLNAESKFIQDVTSVGTQAEVPCAECVKYNAPTRSIRRFFWDSIKCLFQLFAVVCFVCAVCVLYGVRRAPCRELPARWLRPADLVDMLLRVEYVADVPM